MKNQQNGRTVRRAILLAAGRGRRLRPFTDDVPKPLLPVNERPTLDFILTALRQVKVTEVAFIVHYLAEQIEAFVRDGGQWGISPTFFHQEQMWGTGHAVKTAVSFLTEPCYIIAADYILAPDYLQPLHRAYQASQAALAVSLKQLSPSEMSQRSSVRFDANGRLAEIVEKPAVGEAPSPYSASLIYIVPPEIRPYLQTLSLSPRQEFEFQQAVNQMLADGYEMCHVVQDPPPEWHPPKKA